MIGKMHKVRVAKGQKTGFIDKWKDVNQWKTKINLKKYNAAIITGQANNLIVLDVDVKKNEKDVKTDGMTEFNKYIEEYEEPDTYKVRTPSGGFHLYFKLTHSDNITRYRLINNLRTRSGYRNAGLDIRSDGGVIIMAGSETENGIYEVVRDVPIIEMPTTLVDWLLTPAANQIPPTMVEEEAERMEKKHFPEKKQYIYPDATDENIIKVLKLLPSKYLNEWEGWFTVSTVLKFHNKKKLWDRWSRQSYKYDKEKNYRVGWRNNWGQYDINYLVGDLIKLGCKEIDYFKKYKPYEPLTVDLSKVRQVDVNNEYISESLNYDLFEQHETIIMQSCTGTGKTTAMANMIEEHFKHNELDNFLSITTRTTLCDQHVVSFKNINIEHYQKCDDVYDTRSLTICLNSLYKLIDLTEDEMKDYILYIDEIKAFLEMTHNSTLEKRLKATTRLLFRLIKYAKKVIVSDAIIDDNVLRFLKNRRDIVFINNSFKKYEGINAIRLRNENDFRDRLLSHCNHEKPFLFGCDSKDAVSSLYHYCKKNTPAELHDRFLLITDEYTNSLSDVSELFKNKFVFYSPKITFGVDFTILDKQDVFIYIKGGSIQPHGMFQQATRTRNIDTLYYYGEVGEIPYTFINLEQAKEDIKNGAKMSKELHDLCYQPNEDMEYVFIEHAFFHLYCYNEYVYDCYKTNKVKHFELILEANGFKLTEEGEKQKINPREKDKMRSVVYDIKVELFEQFMEDEDGTKEEYEAIRHNIEYLQLNTREQFREYKDIIIDKYKIEEHDNIIRLFKTDEYILGKLSQSRKNAFDVAVINNIYNKIYLIRQIEQKYNINLFNLRNVKENHNIEMGDDFYKFLKSVFRLTKVKPKDMRELIKLYVGLVRHVGGNDLITSTQLRKGADRGLVVYSLTDNVVDLHLKIHSLKDNHMREFIPNIRVDKYIIKSEQEPTDDSVDFID